MRESLPCLRHGTSMVPSVGTTPITLKIRASIALVRLTINPNWLMFSSHENWLEDLTELMSMREYFWIFKVSIRFSKIVILGTVSILVWSVPA